LTFIAVVAPIAVLQWCSV